MTTAEQSTETMNNRISDLMWKIVFSPRLRRSFCNLSEAHTQKPKPCRYHRNDSYGRCHERLAIGHLGSLFRPNLPYDLFHVLPVLEAAT